jgi:hypothetical protein
MREPPQTASSRMKGSDCFIEENTLGFRYTYCPFDILSEKQIRNRTRRVVDHTAAGNMGPGRESKHENPNSI